MTTPDSRGVLALAGRIIEDRRLHQNPSSPAATPPNTKYVRVDTMSSRSLLNHELATDHAISKGNFDAARI